MGIKWERFYEGKIRSLESEALVWAGSLAARTSPSRGEDHWFKSGPAHHLVCAATSRLSFEDFFEGAAEFLGFSE